MFKKISKIILTLSLILSTSIALAAPPQHKPHHNNRPASLNRIEKPAAHKAPSFAIKHNNSHRMHKTPPPMIHKAPPVVHKAPPPYHPSPKYHPDYRHTPPPVYHRHIPPPPLPRRVFIPFQPYDEYYYEGINYRPHPIHGPHYVGYWDDYYDVLPPIPYHSCTNPNCRGYVISRTVGGIISTILLHTLR